MGLILDKAAPEAKAEGDGAPESEIDVTPEMIEAGLAEFRQFDDDFDDMRDCVANIFLAMSAHRPRTSE